MEKELEEYYGKLVKAMGLFSDITIVEKEIDGEVREAIRVRSDEFMMSDNSGLPENLSILPSRDMQETLGYTYIYVEGLDEKGPIKESESIAELVVRV